MQMYLIGKFLNLLLVSFDWIIEVIEVLDSFFLETLYLCLMLDSLILLVSLKLFDLLLKKLILLLKIFDFEILHLGL